MGAPYHSTHAFWYIFVYLCADAQSCIDVNIHIEVMMMEYILRITAPATEYDDNDTVTTMTDENDDHYLDVNNH